MIFGWTGMLLFLNLTPTLTITMLCCAVLRPRDLVLTARADLACHSHVNHVFSNMKPGDVNPFSSAGKNMLP